MMADVINGVQYIPYHDGQGVLRWGYLREKEKRNPFVFFSHSM